MEFKYRIEGHDQKYALQTSWGCNVPGLIAEDAATDYYSKRDGWDADWPLRIEIFKSNKLLGLFEVELLLVPEFSATRSPAEKNCSLVPKK